MTLQRARIPSVPIEALNLYTLLGNAGVQPGAAEGGPGVAAFGAAVTAALEESFSNQRRLHGRWAQDLFQAVVVSLDDVRLIKDEDVGAFYYDESGPALELPDFRVVRRDGEQLLVDVKNVSPGSLFRAGQLRTQRLRASTVEAQRQYAKLTSGRLVFAHYWASFNMWTVIDSDVLHRVGNWFELDMGTAMKANEFSMLGDRLVITSAKLMLSLFRDSSEPATAEPEKDDAIPFPVGKVCFTCDGQLLTDPVEREIAWYLFSFGGRRGHRGSPAGRARGARARGHHLHCSSGFKQPQRRVVPELDVFRPVHRRHQAAGWGDYSVWLPT